MEQLRKHHPALQRTFAVLALSGVVALACSSCSTSSPVASVNGTEITQSQFDQQLEAMAASPAYVQAFNEQQLQNAEEAEAEAEQEGESTSGISAITLQGTASGPDNYSLEWAVLQLNRVINAQVVSQYLAKEHLAPTPTEVTTAWDAEDATLPAAWQGFTPQLQQTLAREDADHALIETKLSSASGDKSFYTKNKDYFWSQVCVDEVDVAVANASGGVDMSASRAQADRLATQMSSGANAARAASGAFYCLTPEKLIQRSSAYVKGVSDLAVGKAVALPGANGYEVVLVRSRSTIPFDEATQKVIDVVSALGGFQGDGYSDTPLIKILDRASVEVNPQYGAWDAKPPSPYAPQDLSPRQLLTS